MHLSIQTIKNKKKVYNVKVNNRHW